MKTTLMILLALSALVLSGFQAFAEKEAAMDANKMKGKMDHLEIATFAGGCFWCTESDFEKVKGVFEAISGYTGGRTENPTYSEVTTGSTGHAEAVQVQYDPTEVTYEALLDVFWRHVNPTDSRGQFVDRGSQYRPEIFYHTPEQKMAAETSKKALEKSRVFDKPIVTPITPFEKFYPAEDYHQDYYKKNANRYKYYRWGSGRDQFLDKTWKDVKMEKNLHMPEASWSRPGDSEIRQQLTPLQYKVTQDNGTEQPFNNEYWDNKMAGIYVDIVSGEPLFSSRDKFKSGTGWPSFTKPLEPEYIVEKTDKTLFMVRTEVRSRIADSHLGHLFTDGPAPTGLRYCINSASLRFVPVDELEAQGYAKYREMF